MSAPDWLAWAQVLGVPILGYLVKMHAMLHASIERQRAIDGRLRVVEKRMGLRGADDARESGVFGP